VAEQGQVLSLPVVWTGVDDLPVHIVNQFLGQVHSGEIFLTLGVVAPPILLGVEAEAGLPRLTYVPARPVARLALTPERLDELVRVLQRVRQMYDSETRLEEGVGQ